MLRIWDLLISLAGITIFQYTICCLFIQILYTIFMVATSMYPKSVSSFIRSEKSRIRKSVGDLEKQKSLIAELYQKVEVYKKKNK